MVTQGIFREVHHSNITLLGGESFPHARTGLILRLNPGRIGFPNRSAADYGAVYELPLRTGGGSSRNALGWKGYTIPKARECVAYFFVL
jgi:hypothetical protein